MSNSKRSAVLRALGKAGLVTVPDVPAEQPAQETAPASAGTATPEAIDKLKADIGMDRGNAYSSLMTILGTLEKAIPDAKARYQTALDVAQKTQAISREMILQYFADMRGGLDKASQDSAMKLETLRAREVKPREAAFDELTAQVAAKREELKQLEVDAAKAQEALSTAKGSVDAVAANFIAARTAVEAELNADEAQFKEMVG